MTTKMLWTSSQQVANVLRRMAEERSTEARRIGQLIAELRLAKGWNQQDLAHEINVGVSTISRWERGLHAGYGSNVRKLAEVLEVSPSVLRPTQPDTETQMDRIEAQLDQVLLNQAQAVTRDAEVLKQIEALRRAMPGSQ
jgi:transcriptional regulator with XRE-family HTH domain